MAAMEDSIRRRTLPAAAAILLLLRLVLVVTAGGDGSCSGNGGRQLWVFGDSYADTGNLGNLGRELTRAWYDPYGRTFPRRPTGRFSDGRVLTDFVASAVGIATPVAYKLRRGVPGVLLARGMNFAVGGSGVLDTGYFQRNLSAQIDLFQAHLRGCAPAGGVALVVVSGNDYAAVVEKDNSTSAAMAYIPTVVRGLREQLRRLRDEVGMRKVVVTNLHPMGCTPFFTRKLNYSGCDPIANAGSDKHNEALRSVLAALDPDNRTFLLLDLHTPFTGFIDDDHPSSSSSNASARSSSKTKTRFPMRLRLRPCCESFSADGYCGQQDDAGKRLYTLCDEPEQHFYWDDVHPTQAAWAAVADTFRATIHDFLST
ncbi:hypothetical protein ABZP36_036132 [Zizania latifolia]